jgi:hypothetical protein
MPTGKPPATRDTAAHSNGGGGKGYWFGNEVRRQAGLGADAGPGLSCYLTGNVGVYASLFSCDVKLSVVPPDGRTRVAPY